LHQRRPHQPRASRDQNLHSLSSNGKAFVAMPVVAAFMRRLPESRAALAGLLSAGYNHRVPL
jgi:hypothetical protein